MKICTKCGIKKELAEFNKKSRNKDGHSHAIDSANNGFVYLNFKPVISIFGLTSS